MILTNMSSVSGYSIVNTIGLVSAQRVYTYSSLLELNEEIRLKEDEILDKLIDGSRKLHENSIVDAIVDIVINHQLVEYDGNFLLLISCYGTAVELSRDR